MRARRFSAALCRGLIEAMAPGGGPSPAPLGFPRLYAAASLKPARFRVLGARHVEGFPRLYAAASLKQDRAGAVPWWPVGFSAALCRGLIEALLMASRPQLLAAVFRGFMPRPH